MKKKRARTRKLWWGPILLLLGLGLTYPRWITLLYPLPYYDVVLEQATAQQVDPWLVFAIMRAESRFNQQAESAAGARGLMQVMPATAAWITQKAGDDIPEGDLYQPEFNICLGCWYLNYLQVNFTYRTPLVIAAYNAGPAQVEQWLEAGIWSGEADDLDTIPFAETRNYVKSVLRGYAAYQLLN